MTDASEIDRAIARKDVVRGPSDRSFGLTFAVIFALVGAYPWLLGGAPRWWALGAAGAVAALAIARPALLAPSFLQSSKARFLTFFSKTFRCATACRISWRSGVLETSAR